MLAKRIIPCLDVDGGRVKKGVRFQELRDAGDPVAVAATGCSERAEAQVVIAGGAWSGTVSISDMLTQLPEVTVETSQTTTAGGGNAQRLREAILRDISTGAGTETLLMVNGMRVPIQSFSAELIDPSIIAPIATQRVDVLDFDLESGEVSDRRPFAAIPEEDGIPDGLALDDPNSLASKLDTKGSVLDSILGVLACYVGAFLVMPISFAAYAVAYRRVFPETGSLGGPAPPPPPGSWAA